MSGTSGDEGHKDVKIRLPGRRRVVLIVGYTYRNWRHRWALGVKSNIARSPTGKMITELGERSTLIGCSPHIQQPVADNLHRKSIHSC